MRRWRWKSHCASGQDFVMKETSIGEKVQATEKLSAVAIQRQEDGVLIFANFAINGVGHVLESWMVP